MNVLELTWILTIISRSQEQVTFRNSASALWFKTGQHVLIQNKKDIFFTVNSRHILYTTGNSWSYPTLPVRLFKSCRVELFQQEMGNKVAGIFVWFVEHIPVDNRIICDVVGRKL